MAGLVVGAGGPAALHGPRHRLRRAAPARPLHRDRRRGGDRRCSAARACRSRAPPPPSSPSSSRCRPRFGLGGLLLATVMAGVLLVVLGVSGMGRLVEFVPFPVTTGFTAGIAVVIATLQLPDFLGPHRRAHARALPVEARRALRAALPTMRPAELAVGMVTLAVLIVWPRWSRRIPAPLVAIVVGGRVRVRAGAGRRRLRRRHHQQPLHVRGPRGGARGHPPPAPAAACCPGGCPGPAASRSSSSFALIRALAPAAFAIAMLGAIESLLSAVVADGMTGHKHDSDAELVAQGDRQHGGARSSAASPPPAPWRAPPPTSAPARARRWPRSSIPSSCSWRWSSSPRSSATCPWRRWPPCCWWWPGTWASGGTSATRCGARRGPTWPSSSPASGSPWCSTWWWR